LEAEVLPELDELSHPEEERRLRFHVNGTDSLGARVPGVERAEDAPSAERDDERRQLEPGDDPAVEEAAGEPDEEPEDERGFDRPAVDDSGPAHYHMAEDHDRTDGKIDAGGQDHQGLRDTEDGNDRHLLQYDGQ